MKRYWVWSSHNSWYSAFIVERGNRRVYLQWMELTLSESIPIDASAKNVLAAWNNQGL